MNNKQLDSYSMLIISKYFKSKQDFINVICVNSKFQETTEKLRFNPIPITSLKLFPKIQTQYLYDEDDTMIEDIDNYEIWYEIDYDKYLKYNNDNVKIHNIVYAHKNRLKCGDEIPNGVNILGKECFGEENYILGDASMIEEITIPSTIKSLGDGCFNGCLSLKSVTLLSSLTSLGECCFNNCIFLTFISLHERMDSLSYHCFLIAHHCNQLIYHQQ